MNEVDKLKAELTYAVDHIAKLTDFSIWMTGCCELTQYEYFIKNRHLLSEPPIYIEKDKEAKIYRELLNGEVIRADDEFYTEENPEPPYEPREWLEVGFFEAGKKYISGAHAPMRRKIEEATS